MSVSSSSCDNNNIHPCDMVVMNCGGDRTLYADEPLPVDYCYMRVFALKLIAEDPDCPKREPDELECVYFVRIVRANLKKYVIFLYKQWEEQMTTFFYHEKLGDPKSPIEYLDVKMELNDGHSMTLVFRCGTPAKKVYFVYFPAVSKENLPDFVKETYDSIGRTHNRNGVFQKGSDYEKIRKQNLKIMQECINVTMKMRDEAEKARRQAQKELEEEEDEEEEETGEKESKRRRFNDDDIDSDECDDDDDDEENEEKEDDEDDDNDDDDDDDDDDDNNNNGHVIARFVTRTTSYPDGSVETTTYREI